MFKGKVDFIVNKLKNTIANDSLTFIFFNSNLVP